MIRRQYGRIGVATDTGNAKPVGIASQKAQITRSTTRVSSHHRVIGLNLAAELPSGCAEIPILTGSARAVGGLTLSNSV
jgi:hypothetical protein